jgi:hypothetical protein
MNQTRRRPSIAAIRALAVAAAAAIAVSIAPASVQAYTGEQVRYATETVNLPYEQFLARKADFKSQGCEQPPWQQQIPYFCHKPSPYNAFDWTDDGCSPPTPDSWKSLFNGPCQLHDFGYRNFGKGLSLGRNENTRSWIDNRFRIEMQRLCNNNFPHPWQYPNREACFNEAQIIWQGVRQGSFFPGGDWSQPLPPGVCCEKIGINTTSCTTCCPASSRTAVSSRKAAAGSPGTPLSATVLGLCLHLAHDRTYEREYMG